MWDVQKNRCQVQAADHFATAQRDGVKMVTCIDSVMPKTHVFLKFRDIFFMRVISSLERPFSSLDLVIARSNFRIVCQICKKSVAGELHDK
jgi:hypothetical protein